MTDKTYSNRSNAMRAAKAAGIPAAEVVIVGNFETGFTFNQAAMAMAAPPVQATVAAKPVATEDDGLTIPAELRRPKDTPDEAAARRARIDANASQTIKSPVIVNPGKQESATMKTKTVKTVKAAKPTKSGTPRGERGAKEPSGMVVKILALASREDGCTRAELDKLTGWKGAPWKWLFSNPKANGYCDRWGYTLSVHQTVVPKGERPTTVYFVKKNKGAAKAA